MIKLKYGNTNTFYLAGTNGGLLIDTDYAGTLPQFFRAIKAAGIGLRDISYLLATHYHPDHCGLAGELQTLGVRLLMMDVQLGSVHYADAVFARDSRLHYQPIDERAATVIRCDESRAFLQSLGIGGEIIHTPSHSPDSISLILDDGCCFVGDLEPLAYLSAYESNSPLEKDWQTVLQYHPKRILYAHANEKNCKPNQDGRKRGDAQ
ncbi:MAG: MBL fold metallo-hydrolase [Oscillospiraceae bacterium]|nr:MBL fold metallo-hydrolase [Oscillospiraceae bacterium]